MFGRRRPEAIGEDREDHVRLVDDLRIEYVLGIFAEGGRTTFV
ncbi:hypothetical protein N602_06945 [Mycobacterium avium subsp. hominissuis 10-5606]|nr:hypothetical protein N602_06945 [Mycobacterium avium subsp. hominissuis 10-5606]